MLSLVLTALDDCPGKSLILGAFVEWAGASSTFGGLRSNTAPAVQGEIGSCLGGSGKSWNWDGVS